jgi:hypothetical protein
VTDSEARAAWLMWLRAVFVRVIRVSAATAIASITASAAVSTIEVEWDVVAGITLLAAIIEALVCLASLPEAPMPAHLFGSSSDDAEPTDQGELP